MAGQLQEGNRGKREAAYLDEIELQIPHVKDGKLAVDKFQTLVTEAVTVGGVARSKILSLLQAKGISVIEKRGDSGLKIEEAKELASHASAIYRKNLRNEEFSFGSGPKQGNVTVDLMSARQEISPDIGKRFDAHGIAKGSVAEQLESLNRLLTKGPDPSKTLHTTKLRLSERDEIAAAAAIGAGGPYSNGGFIIVSHPDKMIADGIAGVLVNEHFYEAIPVLRLRFPEVKFIRADELKTGLEELLVN
jgi:hypothetical protein